MCKAVESTGAEKPIILYCFIHQQALCSNSLEISEVMTAVNKTVNYIHSYSQKHSQFYSIQVFLAEMDSNYPDVPYHCGVRWLSRSRVLQQFLELHVVIE